MEPNFIALLKEFGLPSALVVYFIYRDLKYLRELKEHAVLEERLLRLIYANLSPLHPANHDATHLIK